MNNIQWDSVVKGLHTKTLPSGKKVFMFYYRTREGVQRRPKIGDADQLSLAAAREIARNLTLKVLNGADPKLEWRNSRAEWTVSDLFNHVWKEYWDKPRFHESRWAREVQYNYRNHIAPHFAKLKLSEVTPPEVRKWHRQLSDRPNASNRSLEILSRMYGFAEEEGFRPSGSNPCSMIAAHTERKRSRFATREEIQKIGKVLEREKTAYPREVLFIYVLLFSGARPKWIQKAQKSDLKIADGFGILTLDGKSTHHSGEKETVVLPRELVSQIEALPTSGTTLLGSRYPATLWRKIQKELDLSDLWLRDLRRTFATLAFSHGGAPGTVGELLNHRSAQTTKIYAKLSDEKRIELVANTAKEIASCLAL